MISSRVFQTSLLSRKYSDQNEYWQLVFLHENDWPDWTLQENEISDYIQGWFCDCIDNETVYRNAVIPICQDQPSEAALTPGPNQIQDETDTSEEIIPEGISHRIPLEWFRELDRHGYKYRIEKFSEFYGLIITL
jgi:hypothetical protein